MAAAYSDDELERLAAFYEEHGAVHLPGLLEPDWVERILAEVNRTIPEFTASRPPGTALNFGRGKGRMTIRYMWVENQTVRDFLFRERLTIPLARITRSKELRFWFDLTFIHEPDANGEAGEGTLWHHDISAFGFRGEKLPSLWMALTAATQDQSRLEFIDGSHKSVAGFYRPPMVPVKPDDNMLPLPDYNALVAAGQERILTWDCAPGDALIIHPYTIHGARGNQGTGESGRRVAMTSRWLGDDVRWLPTDPDLARAVPVSGKALPLGARPSGPNFPLVYKAS